MDYQVMPELTPEEYAELKADISQRGVMVPIEYDELGNVLDGYHRLKICGELGIKDFPRVIRAGMTEAEKLTHARKLNIARRHLTNAQKHVLIACRYSDDFSCYKVVALNEYALKFIPERTELDEIGWVSLLYKIRGHEVTPEFLERMKLEI